MDKRLVFQGAAFAALVAFVAIVAQAAASLSLPEGVQVQPGLPLSSSEFLVASTEFSEITLGFFGANTLFVLSYLIVFARLYARTREQPRPFALVGLLAGNLTALMDTPKTATLLLTPLQNRRC